MKKIDWKKLKENCLKRARNLYFWLGLGSIAVLFSQQLGFDLSTVPFVGDYESIVKAIFALLASLGVAVNTSTPGIGD